MGSGQFVLWMATLCLTVPQISHELTQCVCPTAQAATTAQLTSSHSLSLCNSVTAIISPALTEPNIFLL